MKEIILNVEGMMCTGCENRIVNAVSTIEGVESVKANHETGKVTITAEEDKIEEIKNKINDIGFTVKE